LSKHVAFVLALASAISVSVASRAGTDLTTSWDNGLVLQSQDKSFKLKIGGRIQNDWAWFRQDDKNMPPAFNDQQDGTEFRRARLAMSGTMYTYVLFKAEYDFAGAAKAGKEVAFKDVYLGVTGIPGVGTLQFGHQKEPFGLEMLTSDDFTTFMERSSLTLGDYLSERNTGIRQQNSYANERLTLMSGIFRDTDNGGRQSQDGRYAGTVRVTGLPWRDEGKHGIFHLGAAYSYRNKTGADAAIETKPSAHLSDESIKTGSIASEAINFYEGEGALTYGAFSAQGEYMVSAFDASAAGDPSFQGYYVYASAFVTGESRTYKASEGIFDRIKPKKNFRQDGNGIGAVELGARYQFVDLNDQAVFGGEMSEVTVGANWYLNPNTRMMMNYVMSNFDKVGGTEMDKGTLSTFEVRFQIDF